MLFRLIVLLILTFPAAFVCAEDSVPAEELPASDQSDMYYNAMIRSIDLDKTRWKPFSRSMESGPWFYDTRSLKRSGKKVTTLVTVFPHPQKTAIYSPVFSDHAKIRKIVFETEITCNTHTYRQPLIQVYGYANELLAEYSNTGNKAAPSIKPGTTTDTLRSLLCGPD